MVKVDIREVREMLLGLKNENREMAGKILRTVVRLTAQYVIRSHVDGARYTPAYSGNMLANWQVHLRGKQAEYNPLPHYKERQPLADEELGFEPMNGYANISYKQLAHEKMRELSEATYNITWNSKVVFENTAPYEVKAGTVTGISDLSGKAFTETLRNVNFRALSIGSIHAFALDVVPAVTAAVLAGHKHITYKTLSEKIE